MSYINPIRRKLAEKGKIFGTNILMRDPVMTEMLASIYDFLWIDQEHSWLDRGTIIDHLIAARAADAASLVRVPWNDPILSKPILDMGPDAIIFPMIRTAEEARAAISGCAYPPAGIRSWGPVRAADYGLTPALDYIAQSHDRAFKILQIEHMDALKELDAILDVEGVDCICVGPNDLSGSLGKITQTLEPDVVEACDKIAACAAKHNVPLMTSIPYNETAIKQWVDRGTVIFDISSDYTSMLIESQRQLEWMMKNCF